MRYVLIYLLPISYSAARPFQVELRSATPRVEQTNIFTASHKRTMLALPNTELVENFYNKIYLMNLFSIVKDIGLGPKEARIYLACLELGSSTVSDIADKSGVNRVTAYSILEKLIKKGFIHFLTKDGVKFFDATDPEIVKRELKRKISEFSHALPAFKRLRGEASHPKIQYFEGIEGIKALYADTLSSKTEILNYSNSKEIRDHWPNYDEEYVKERVRRKIYLRGISPLDEHGLRVQTEDKENYRELRLVPATEFSFTNEINIYDDKVAITSFKDIPLIGMIIESLEVANTQRDIFKMAWEFSAQFMLRRKTRG